MSKHDFCPCPSEPEIWRNAINYKSLLIADRRCFAWEWLRRTDTYRAAYRDQSLSPSAFGLLGYEDPTLATPKARPIWSPDIDAKVLASRANGKLRANGDMLDIRTLANFASVKVDDTQSEHWLLTDGHWTVRLDLHDGTLLGGPLLLEHHMHGFKSADAKMTTLRQLAALAENGAMPPSLTPRESRASRWILELRTADALASHATQQDMARAFYGDAIAKEQWRIESGTYRLRVRRLVRAARAHLADPFSGPWFR